jgi:hypothetical protein
MPNLFAMTAAPDKLKTETGSATTSITVTNSTSRPLRGVVKVKPLGNTQAQWLKIDGETERDFPAGGTHQFTVIFNKPKTAPTPAATQPAESFQFRVDAISATNPDEDFTEGPVVTVEIPEVVVKPKTKVPWWVWLIIGLVVLAIIGGIVAFLLNRKGDEKPPDNPTPTPTPIVTPTETPAVTPTVSPTGAPTFKTIPNLNGRTFDDAHRTLTNLGLLTEKVEEISPSGRVNVVFKQQPTGRVEVGPQPLIVKLFVPAATTVPALKNRTIAEAINQLEVRGLKVKNVTASLQGVKSGEIGVVQTQSPTENFDVVKGATVNLTFTCTPNPPAILPQLKCVTITAGGAAPSGIVVERNLKAILDMR